MFDYAQAGVVWGMPPAYETWEYRPFNYQRMAFPLAVTELIGSWDTCRQAAQEVYELRALKAEVVAGKMRRKALKKKPLYAKYRGYFEEGPEDSSLAAMAEEIARRLAGERDGRKN